MSDQLETLRNIPLFSLLTDDKDLAEFLKAGQWSKYTSGGIIFRIGAPAPNIYVIATGKVLLTQNKKSLATLGQGDIFGEVGPFLDLGRTVNAIATADTLVFEFSLAALDRIRLEISNEILKHIHAVTARRFVESTRKLSCA
ncbi:MAG: cyclic nucleotide-binding domain-containing protein [Desulfovibrionaceae bacterium]|nr:cyclic nucleotide-binding domain-containing protein [Desulfovibrionaceae bacterium]MBF0514089.1 cyclic nucleotide-binding domain-containing protein [Desulfovibrionaceae bacterium]